MPILSALNFVPAKLAMNMTWSVGAELCAKFVRILSLFALAWALPIEQYGTAMLALALKDILRVLMRYSAGEQVVQCDDKDFSITLFNGVVLQWLFCIVLVVTQIGVGWLAAEFYQQPMLFLLLLYGSPVFLFYPIVCARVFVLTRNNQLATLSAITAASLSCENLAVALAAFSGAGLYAIVVGKYVFGVVWAGMFLRHQAPKLVGRIDFPKMASMCRTSIKLALSEAARALRLQVDLLVAGKLMAPELVGYYSVARNASFGISQSLLNAFERALYPYLCKLRRAEQLAPFKAKLVLLFTVIALGLCVQAWLVPYYLPLLFGDKWSAAITAAAWLCIAMIPFTLTDLTCCVVRAQGHFALEMVLRCLATFTLFLWLLIMQSQAPQQFAMATVQASILSGLGILLLLFLYQRLPALVTVKERSYEL